MYVYIYIYVSGNLVIAFWKWVTYFEEVGHFLVRKIDTICDFKTSLTLQSLLAVSDVQRSGHWKRVVHIFIKRTHYSRNQSRLQLLDSSLTGLESAILNLESSILESCDSKVVLSIDGMWSGWRFWIAFPRSIAIHYFASCCGISGDSRPAILGIVRFAIRDFVPLRFQQN